MARELASLQHELHTDLTPSVSTHAAVLATAMSIIVRRSIPNLPVASQNLMQVSFKPLGFLCK